MTARLGPAFALVAACAALAAAAPLPLQEPAPVPPREAAPEPTDVSGVAADVIEGTEVPGLALALWQGGRLRSIGAAGVRALGEDAAVTTGDRWHLGSCTKAMTAALCLLAVERELLSLDATLAELLGERGYALDPQAATIRLEQLLDHTSGLPANDLGLMARRLDDPRTLRETRREAAEKILGVAPEAGPGERFEYSNLGYVVAGVVLEEVFDTGWETLMRRELFEPLGMESAGFGAPGTPDALDEPRGHVGAGDRRRAVPPGPRGDNPAWLGPAGTVHATLADWLAFLALVVAAPEQGGVLSPASVDRLVTPAEGRDYALGWRVTPRDWADGTALTHAGSNTMWFAVCWLSPARDLVVVAAANAADDEARKACDRAAWRLLSAWPKGEDGR